MQKTKKSTCFKCGQKPHLKYRLNMNICRSCFDLYVMLKRFRKNVRNQVDVVGKNNEIVAFLDGTLQSVCLLQLFSENLHRANQTNGKLINKTYIRID